MTDNARAPQMTSSYNGPLTALRTLGAVRMPIAWHLSYGLVIGLWFASHDMDRWVTLLASGLLLVSMIRMVTLVTRRRGGTAARLRDMPAPLRRAYLWPALAGCMVMAVGIYALSSAGPGVSGLAIGAVVAPLMTCLAITAETHYSAVARRLIRSRRRRQVASSVKSTS